MHFLTVLQAGKSKIKVLAASKGLLASLSYDGRWKGKDSTCVRETERKVGKLVLLQGIPSCRNKSTPMKAALILLIALIKHLLTVPSFQHITFGEQIQAMVRTFNIYLFSYLFM
jgi:hypothetical protein